MATGSTGATAARRRVSAADWRLRVPDRQYPLDADISARGRGVSAVAMLGRAVDRRAQLQFA
jgi:hypothetical protein